MNVDELYLNRCFELAEKGRGNTKTNPLVGAILVYNHMIIGEGYHMKYGEAHAEVNCINSVIELNRDKISEATLYISLEPCMIHGKTPPCTDLIIKNKIKKVIIGSTDFNPLVHNKGIHYLTQQGVEVVNYNWIAKQIELNKSFYINQLSKRPFYIVKYAESYDGFIGVEHEETKITPIEVDTWSHQLRSQVDAILIGKNTLINDKPQLNTRLYKGNDPDIIVLDRSPELKHYEYLKGRPVIVFNEYQDETIDTIHFIKVYSVLDLEYISLELLKRSYSSVLIEGGSQIINSFNKAQLIDKVVKITNNNLKLSKGIPSPIIDFKGFNNKMIYTILETQIELYTK